jgi:hypothetical protein
MANLYVRSTDGSDVDNGTTWALAKATVAGATAIDAAGDVIYVSQAHAESIASSQTWAFAGSIINPVKLIGGNDGAEPPTTASTAPTCAVTGATAYTFSGSAYVYGLNLSAGSGANSNSINFNSSGVHAQTWESCTFYLVGTGATQGFFFNTAHQANDQKLVIKNCTFRFSNTGGKFWLEGGDVHWKGGGIHASSSAITQLFDNQGYACNFTGEDLDLSAGAAGMHIATKDQYGKIILKRCKLPSGWSGSLTSLAMVTHPATRIELWNCASDNKFYKTRIRTWTGDLTDEATIVKTGGASDEGTSISYKVVTTANAAWAYPFETCEFLFNTTTVGSSVTATVDVVTDNVTLTQNDIWLEVSYLGSSATPLGTIGSSTTSPLSTTAVTTSTATWTTTGLTTPVTQKLQVTFTPNAAGVYVAKVFVAKASTTVYIDPKVVVA